MAEWGVWSQIPEKCCLVPVYIFKLLCLSATWLGGQKGAYVSWFWLG